MIRWLVAIIGAPVVLGLIAVSVILNFRFGTLLATADEDKLVYGLASGCADLLKGVLPFVIAWGWGSRKWLVGFVASLLFGTFTAYSVTSALGFAALNRDGTSGKRQSVIERQQHLRSELVRKRQDRAVLPAARPVATIDGELAAARQNTRWDATSGCTKATLPESRSFCDGYFRLTAERGNALAAAQLDGDVARLSQALHGGEMAATSGTADPQVALLSQLLQLGEDKTKLVLALLIAALVELGSGLGFFVVFAMWEKQPLPASLATPANAVPVVVTEPIGSSLPALLPASSVNTPLTVPPAAIVARSDWFLERVEAVPDAQASLTALYEDYCHTLKARGITEAMTWSGFRDWLVELGFTENPIRKGPVKFSGVLLKSRNQ
jgi:hypothetical protein